MKKKNFVHCILRAAAETETTQENFQNWFELDEGSIMISSYFISTIYIIKCSIYLFSKVFCCPLKISFASLISIIA
jgi:hypothetical protein